MKIILIIVIIIILNFYFFCWCLCRAASNYDRKMEEFLEKENKE